MPSNKNLKKTCFHLSEVVEQGKLTIYNNKIFSIITPHKKYP